MSVVVGIDYSMSSPSICVHRGKTWSFDNCKFYFLTPKKKYTFKTDVFHGELHTSYSSQEERFSNIASWAVSKIPSAAKLGIEGYAYAAKGVVFDIGENTGLLKHFLWTGKKQFSVYSPTTIKKFAAGKGNANKLAMYESFVAETGVDISSMIHCNEGESPMSDIIDSYYIAKYAFHES
jgi:hypothetical protein